MLLWDRKRYDKVAPSGVGFNVEGAWFFTPNLGVGGQAKVGRYADLMEKGALGEGHIADPQPLNSLAVQGGLFYNLPLDSRERWSVGAKALAGMAKNHYQKNEVVDNGGNIIGHLEHSPVEHFTATLGLSLRYIAADNLGVRLFADYNWMRTSATYTPQTGTPQGFAAYRTPLSVGVAFDAMLW